MSYRTLQVERYFFIRWDRPRVADLDGLIAKTAEARRAARGPLVMFSLIQASGAPPDAAFRKKIVERWATIMPEGDTVHAVIEGTGIGASLNRAVLTAIRMFVRGRGIGKIYSSLETALRDAGLTGKVTREQLRAAQIVE